MLPRFLAKVTRLSQNKLTSLSNWQCQLIIFYFVHLVIFLVLFKQVFGDGHFVPLCVFNEASKLWHPQNFLPQRFGKTEWIGSGTPLKTRHFLLGRVASEDKNGFIPVKRIFGVNTYSCILTVPKGSELRELTHQQSERVKRAERSSERCEGGNEARVQVTLWETQRDCLWLETRP